MRINQPLFEHLMAGVLKMSIARKCDMETAKYLDLSVNEPVAEVRRVVCDSNETIIYIADVIYRGNYIQLGMDYLA